MRNYRSLGFLGICRANEELGRTSRGFERRKGDGVGTDCGEKIFNLPKSEETFPTHVTYNPAIGKCQFAENSAYNLLKFGIKHIFTQE